MGKIIVRGGKPLYGTVRISGSKNAALPVLFATLITDGVSELYGIPDIGDTRVAIALLESLGARVSRQGDLTTVDTRALRYSPPDPSAVRRLRASTYLIGSCLIRFGRVRLSEFGGCSFSPRPIDMHIAAARAFGATESGDGLVLSASAPARIDFDKPSVGATVNALIMAAGTEGESIITGCAVEPHILTLAELLRTSGADILRDGSSFTVRGGSLHGGRVRIECDMIEAGSYLTASLLTGGRVRVLGTGGDELRPFTEPLVRSGAVFDPCRESVTAIAPPVSATEIVAAPYPAFPTDLQPIVAPLLAACCGGSITDRVWQGRLGYLDELSKMGISFVRVGSGARIYRSEPRPTSVTAPDLRGGAALLLWALSGEGESVIDRYEIIERGYERITEKLTALGAEVEVLP